ncbi:MAG: prepilin-type N-terminal cleavage/methylation domain-containing protein [Caulobacteraceae bacterium]
MSRDRRAGFSLIEALVALIIACMCLLAVFELQQAFVKGEERAEHALLVSNLQSDAATLLADLNPSEHPSGLAPLAAGRRLQWTSTPLSGPRQGQGYPAGAGRFEIRLYRVQGDILAADGRLLGRVAFDRMGWRPVMTAASAPAAAPPPHFGGD